MTEQEAQGNAMRNEYLNTIAQGVQRAAQLAGEVAVLQARVTALQAELAEARKPAATETNVVPMKELAAE
jgi:hypothetical protein